MMLPGILLVVAGMVHGGGLVIFAILLQFRHQLSHLREEDVVRVYRAWGMGNGISLGLLILASAWTYTGRVNPGASGLDAWALPRNPIDLAQLIDFLALWVSYAWLEIWTLEPCRLLDRDGVITDRAAYSAAAQRVAWHLAVNALLFVVVVLLGSV